MRQPQKDVHEEHGAGVGHDGQTVNISFLLQRQIDQNGQK